MRAVEAILRAPLAAAAALRPDIVWSVATAERTLALTFDDGPDPQLTPQLLALLRAHDARATFFLLGERAERHPHLARAIAADGHELGNHLWRDERAAALSDAEFERSLLRTQAVLAPHGRLRLMRPGSGLVDRGKVHIAERHGYRCVLGSAYAFDPQLPFARWVRWNLLAAARPGAILILHEGDPSRAYVLDVLDALLPGLVRRGYRATSASELIEGAGSPSSSTSGARSTRPR